LLECFKILMVFDQSDLESFVREQPGGCASRKSVADHRDIEVPLLRRLARIMGSASLFKVHIRNPKQ
jgi:hypothetical protein